MMSRTCRGWAARLPASFLFAALSACGSSLPQLASTPPSPSEEAGPPAPSGPVRRQTLVGRWHGVGEQAGEGTDGQTWYLVLDLRSTGVGQCGTIEYPEPDWTCRGVYVCEQGGDSRSARAREQITERRDRCIDQDVTMRLDELGNLRWEAQAGGIRAWAILSPLE